MSNKAAAAPKANHFLATIRPESGKSGARATRRTGQTPAVIYGDKQPPVLIAVDANRLFHESQKPGFFTRMYDIEIDGKIHKVLPRDVQLHPLSDMPEHADFLRVSGNTRVRVAVPVVFINQDKSPGLKRGGTLNVVQHKLDLWCQASAIPSKVEIDVAGKMIGDTIHISSIKLPEGTKSTSIQDLTIASVAAPTAVRDEALAAVEAAKAATAAAAAPAEGAAAAAPAAGAAAPAAAAGKAPAAGAAAPAAAKAPAKK